MTLVHKAHGNAFFKLIQNEACTNDLETKLACGPECLPLSLLKGKAG